MNILKPACFFKYIADDMGGGKCSGGHKRMEQVVSYDLKWVFKQVISCDFKLFLIKILLLRFMLKVKVPLWFETC